MPRRNGRRQPRFVSYLTVPSKIRFHDLVALVENVPATHFLRPKPIQQRRGQIGTVVMLLDDSRFKLNSQTATVAPMQCCRCGTAN